MKKKATFIATLSLAMATTAITAFASPSTTQENAIPESSVVSVQPVDSNITNSSENGIIVPFQLDKSWPDVANNGTANVSNSFRVNAGFGHLKLLIKNLSNSLVTVTLQNIDTGKVYINGVQVYKGSPLDWKSFEQNYAQGMQSGNYILQWSGGGSVVMGNCTEN